MRFGSALVVALAALIAAGCSSSGESPRATVKSSAPVVASVAVPEAPKEPPTPSEEVTFETSDKVPLSGTFYLAKDPTAPVLVLVHRFRGDRQEWAPLLTRLAEAKRRYSVLAFDLRGHGASKSSSGKKRVDFSDMKEKDMPRFVEDVHAALGFAFGKTEGKATRAVVVGSSLGAAIGARASSQDARVVAIGMVSPGAAIQGYDVYHPFADVRMLPSFLAGAKEDTVSREPIDGLSRMAKDLATVKAYDGRGHGIAGLVQEGGAVFDDLESWLMSVFDAQPVVREIAPRGDSKKKEHRG
jgi:pimeloyl-ACP methyl ester carboxylesterase